MTAPTMPLQRAGTTPDSTAARALDGAWRAGYGFGYRCGRHDGYETRELQILEVTAAAAHEVASSPLAVEVARRRGERDRSDVAFDAYSTGANGRRVWDEDARAALVAWCLHSWAEDDR